MLLQRSGEVSSKPGSLPVPRFVVPRPAIEESAPGHHRGQIPHSTIRTGLLLLMKIKAMSPTVVLQQDYKRAAGH